MSDPVIIKPASHKNSNWKEFFTNAKLDPCLGRHSGIRQLKLLAQDIFMLRFFKTDKPTPAHPRAAVPR
jgi:hypothetical protein